MPDREFLPSLHSEVTKSRPSCGIQRECRNSTALSRRNAMPIALMISRRWRCDVPEPYKAESRAGCAFLDLLRQTSDLDWTFLSPSAQFIAGERTGVFRLGTDTALRDANGRSWISYEDYAVSLVDEIEQPSHSRRRFTVGY